MPNWKKVIVSGSNAHLNNITASGNFSALDNGFTVNDHSSTELFVDGNIIATGNVTSENYIVSSTIMHMTQSFSDGSTIFGDTLNDTHLFTGSLFITGITFDDTPQPAAAVLAIDTASGRLYYTGSYGGSGGSGTGFPYAGSDDFTSDPPIAVITGSLTLSGSGNITASGDISAGNISASGDIFADEYVLQNEGVLAVQGGTTFSMGSTSRASIYRGTQHTFVNAITASNISASGDLFANLTENTSTQLKTVMYNPLSGKFFRTGSYGGGGDSSISAEAISASIDIATGSLLETASVSGNTITFTQGDSTTFNIDVNPTLQEVTDEGNFTTRGSRFLSSQNLIWGSVPGGHNATSGFVSDGGKAYSRVTPQPAPEGQRWHPVGNLTNPASPGRLDASPNNYLVYNIDFFKIGDSTTQGGGNGIGDGNGGVNDDQSVGGIILEGGGFQLKTTSSGAGIGGISLVPGEGRPSIFFFESASGTVVPSGSFHHGSASAKISIDTGSHAIEFFAGSVNEDLVKVLHISKSGDSPRIGIGTDNPKSTFDFKQVEDTSTGTELLLRTARTSTTGALDGDEGGSINFVIDSGSFNNIKTSGSLAKIKTQVNSVGSTGVQGKLIFELSKGALVSQDIFSYGFDQTDGTDFNLYSQIQTASLLLKDFSATGNSVIEMRDSSDNLKLQIGRGNITASGEISASGDIIAPNLIADSASFSTRIAANEVITAKTLVSGSAQIADVTLTTAAQTNITSLGTLTTLTVDDITINGSTISDGADLTIDAEGDITLDANGADVILKDNGTEFGRFKRDSSDFVIKSATNNKDIVFRGVDDSSTITALTLDMSDAGSATFNNHISASGDLEFENRIFNPSHGTLGSNGAVGDIIKFGNTSTVAGGLYVLNSSGGWTLALASAAATSTGSLAVALGSNSTTDGMCLRGFVNPFTDPGAGIGSPVYISDAAQGRVTATAPSSTGDVVRIVGYQYGTDLIYFNPSNDFIIHA